MTGTHTLVAASCDALHAHLSYARYPYLGRGSLVLGIVLDSVVVASAAREVQSILHEVILVCGGGINHPQR